MQKLQSRETYEEQLPWIRRCYLFPQPRDNTRSGLLARSNTEIRVKIEEKLLKAIRSVATKTNINRTG